MFWKFATTSNIDTLLEKEDITLQELMDDDDVLQECKGQHTKLIEFLGKVEVMEDLVSYIITEPAEDTDDTVKYKYPNVACELLTSDVPQLNDILGDTESLREKLFSFLDHEPTLNPLLASFFSKVVGILLTRKPEPTLDYIKSRPDFLGTVLKHLGTSAIMDLLLRLVTCVEAVDLRAQVLSWLNEKNLVERLISLIDPSQDEDFHCNSAQSLCDIIRLSREHMYTLQESAQDDPLLNTLERKETVQLLLKHMFDGGISESVTINGISVLLALLEIRRPAPFGFPEMAPELTQLDVERLACGVSKTLHGLSDRLPDFHSLLENPPKKDVMSCTFGDLNPPLGNTRLHVGKLLSAILITNTHNINVQLSELQIFNALLDLFFAYEYNNFLHTQVVQCIQTVLGNAVTVTTHTVKAPSYNDGTSRTDDRDEEERKEDEDAENPRKVAPLLTHLFEDCRLIQRILDAWEDNRVHETEAGGHRKGNMGHLTLITNQILENIEKGSNADRIRQFIEGMPEEDQGRWQKFVSEPLAEMNEKNSRELGGHNPMHFSSDDDGETDYRDIPFTSSSAQQAFTDYQLQQITTNFVDQFGFTDGDFAEQEEPDKFNKINSLDFEIKADIQSANEDLFEKVVKTRIPNFGADSDDDDVNKDTFDSGDEDDWDQHIPTTDSSYNYGSGPPTITVRQRTSSGDSTGSSNSSGEDDAPFSIPQTQSPVKAEPSEDMETSHQGQELEVRFGDSDSSSGSNTSTPTSSPRLAQPVANDNKVQSLWDAEKDSDISSSTNESNWANFDNFESLQVQKASTEEANSAFEAPDSSSEVKQIKVETMVLSEEPEISRLVEMEIAAVDSFSTSNISSEEQPSAEVSGAPTTSSDVAMEIQEEPKNIASDAEAKPTSSGITGSHGSPMETDESSSSTVEVAESDQSVSRSRGEVEIVPEGVEEKDTVPVASEQVPEEVSSTSDVEQVEASREVEEPVQPQEDEPEQNNDPDSDITAHVSSTEQSVSDAPPCHTTSSGDQLSSEVEVAPLKTDGDVQNNEVTSSTVDSTVVANGPV
uniref:serine/threonine-protein phosphatase 6 regulatory subunit 3 isoform X1 n=1 Tax=Ciona intestinalis TaxID=7719 RepID=UPI000180D18F|nr:serine/threonine-protein phosphatase 6 regulatory subunit 3 isoform X1 [Ciona intestinalis]|eukprot:XP_002131688.1 serine/threonine-protein phosphatase 6 regulatory subunit 3 isoform X1 [Ciona intestinalis]